MKTLFLFIIGFLSANIVAAQAVEQSALYFWNDPMFPVYVVTAFVFIVLILVASVAVYLIRVLNRFTLEAEAENARRLGVKYVPKEKWWDRLTQKLNASVPVENEKEIELHHSYDGIRELDNHLPPWWKWLFYGTIAWSVIYIIVFHLLDGLPLQIQEYEQELAFADEQAKIFRASRPQEEIDVNTLIFTRDAEIIEKGRAVFVENNCAACHRSDGGGNTIGPNLTDEFWLHGGEAKQIFNTVKNGVVEKGMPSWSKAMSQQDIRNVTFFILSLQGTNPPNAKAAQGEQYKQPAVSDDSTMNSPESTSMNEN